MDKTRGQGSLRGESFKPKYTLTCVLLSLQKTVVPPGERCHSISPTQRLHLVSSRSGYHSQAVKPPSFGREVVGEEEYNKLANN